jgi:acetyl esterase/lipase
VGRDVGAIGCKFFRPTPVKQVNIALSYLQGNAKKFHIDPSHFIFAGDSGGAHIAAQTRAIISNTDHGRLIGISPSIGARQLSGVILYCGPYDAQLINPNSDYSSFIKSVLWAYSETAKNENLRNCAYCLYQKRRFEGRSFREYNCYL